MRVVCWAVVSTHREETGVEVQQSHKHEHKQYSTTQLHVLLWRTLSHGGDPSKHALPFRTGFGQQQKQTTSEGKVSGRGERTVKFPVRAAVSRGWVGVSLVFTYNC